MATNMAPHNLTEVIDACLLVLERERLAAEKIANGEEATENVNLNVLILD
jgi:DNA gyrase/topoisomerase IV subunit A